MCTGKSYTFPRRDDSSCTQFAQQENAPSARIPKFLRAGGANLSARPLHGVAGKLALFPSLAIAVSYLMGPAEICLLDTVQVCFSSPFLIPLSCRA